VTIQEWHTYFDILCDKYGNPYFTDGEKDLLFNRATFKFIDGVTSQLEVGEDILDKIRTLIYTIGPLNMSPSGLVPAFQLAFNTQMYKLLKVVDGNGAPISKVSHNSAGVTRTNIFKKTRTRFEQTNDGFVFYPVDVSKSMYFTAVKTPVYVSLQQPINSELPHRSHNDVIAIAVDMAGIASRDEALAQLNQLTK
jgi:hypothetical protein